MAKLRSFLEFYCFPWHIQLVYALTISVFPPPIKIASTDSQKERYKIWHDFVETLIFANNIYFYYAAQ